MLFHPALNVYTVISKVTGMSTVVVLQLLSGHSSSLCAGVLWAVRAWLSLASCGSVVMRIWRRPRVETWSRSRPRRAPLSVYRPDTMGQRGKYDQQHQTKQRNRTTVTWGEGREGGRGGSIEKVLLLLGLLQREGVVRQRVYGRKMLCCSFHWHHGKWAASASC